MKFRLEQTPDFHMLSVIGVTLWLLMYSMIVQFFEYTLLGLYEGMLWAFLDMFLLVLIVNPYVWVGLKIPLEFRGKDVYLFDPIFDPSWSGMIARFVRSTFVMLLPTLLVASLMSFTPGGFHLGSGLFGIWSVLVVSAILAIAEVFTAYSMYHEAQRVKQA